MTNLRGIASALCSFNIKFIQRTYEISERRLSSFPKPSKPYSDIPAKKGFLPAALNLLRSGGPGYLHEHCDRRHAELGPIFREFLGPVELVFIADTKMIQTVIANEGPQPHHNVPEAWTVYNEVKHIERGIFFQVGEPWARLRRSFNKVLLADPGKITRFTSDIHKINTDLFDSWQQSAKSPRCPLSKGGFIIQDIKFELCKWSVEATGMMLFGHRMGCVASSACESSESRAEKLVNYVANMFAETSKFQVIPCRLAQRLNLGTWRRFEAASDGMLQLANDYTVEFTKKARESSDNRSLIRDLLNLNMLNDVEVSRSMVDLIIAAADTTSNSLQWMLYILAKRPDIQTIISEEVRSLGGDPAAFMEIKQSCPYIGAFVKEVLRLYPTAPFLARTLDHTISLGGYTLPAGVPIVFSLYTTSRMGEYYDDPLVFRPDRWLRNDSEPYPQVRNKISSHAYASLPFGIGKRMCIGRRLAELEMHLLIASIVSKFTISLVDEDDIKIKLKMVLCPDKPIKLRLIPKRDTETCMKLNQ